MSPLFATLTEKHFCDLRLSPGQSFQKKIRRQGGSKFTLKVNLGLHLNGELGNVTLMLNPTLEALHLFQTLSRFSRLSLLKIILEV